MQRELTMSEILTDPLIRLMLKADGISLSDFAEIIQMAAARLKAPAQVFAGATHAVAAETKPTIPHEQVWHEPLRSHGEAPMDIHQRAFSPPVPAFA